MCRNCYQASYIRKKYPNRKKYGINIKDKNFDEIYNKVLELVKNGFTIDKSLKITNIYRGTFYKKINLEQKKELMFYKELSKQIGYIEDDF
jgi:DNA invertase Pin-like site-specific DNA recombinase